MVYGIFFGILFGNIISGIMLDSFGALRERNNELLHDKENFCYICNISRETLEKNRISFQDHITDKHYLWNYVFFIYFLDKKSPTDYSGMEYQITTQYNKPDEEMVIDWVPLGEPVEEKAKYLEENSAEIERILKEFKDIAQEYLA
jgi:inositol 1,4,5-triphosphate receptor type 1/inositol 1,4,5-triphosphate receptor type 3